MTDLATIAALARIAPTRTGIAAWAGAARISPEAAARLAAAFAHGAFAAPERLPEIYDAAAGAWLGAAVGGPALTFEDAAPLPLTDALWAGIAAIGEDRRAGRMDAGEVTRRTAALGAGLDPGARERAVRCALAYPKVAEAAAHGLPPRWRLEDLARCPPASLGAAFRDLIVDNGFDLEVLDREALNLADLPFPLGYLNARILQCHDLWHITAGYRTTGLHEVAISAFQLAQFGHGYSAMFLAVAAIGAVETPERFAVLMDVILSAWAHGRATPPMIAVPWEAVWDLPVAAVRQRFGVVPYDSPWPADLFEQLFPTPAPANLTPAGTA